MVTQALNPSTWELRQEDYKLEDGTGYLSRYYLKKVFVCVHVRVCVSMCEYVLCVSVFEFMWVCEYVCEWVCMCERKQDDSVDRPWPLSLMTVILISKIHILEAENWLLQAFSDVHTQDACIYTHRYKIKFKDKIKKKGQCGRAYLAGRGKKIPDSSSSSATQWVCGQLGLQEILAQNSLSGGAHL